MGLHAGLGLGYMLNEVRSYLSNGDVVVLSMEYNHFYQKISTKSQVRTQLVLLNPNALVFYSITDIIGIIPYGYTPFKSLYAYYIGRYRNDDTVYLRKNFNCRGDFVIPAQANRSYQPHMERRIPNIEQVENEVIKRLNSFAIYALQEDAQVFFVFPPIPKPEYENNMSQISDLYKSLQKEMNIVMLSTPSDHVFPADEFYDTNYHLNSVGRKRRTEQIAIDIKKYYMRDEK